MSFVGRTCGAKERLLYQASYHWLYLTGGLGLIMAPLLGVAVFRDWVGLIVALGVALLIVPFGVGILIRYFATEIAVTTDRFVKKSGLLSIHAEDISLDKLEEFELEQSILGVLFGYGTLEAHGSGRESIRVSLLQSPKRLQLEIENARAAARDKATGHDRSQAIVSAA
jgi:hypothetical protein